MPSLLEPNARAATIARVDRLTQSSTPTWGRMTVSQMLAHLTDAMRMTFGELPVKRKHIPLIASFPFKQLVRYVLPFPKGGHSALRTAPNLWAAHRTADGSAVAQAHQSSSDAVWRVMGGRLFSARA